MGNTADTLENDEEDYANDLAQKRRKGRKRIDSSSSEGDIDVESDVSSLSVLKEKQKRKCGQISYAPTKQEKTQTRNEAKYCSLLAQPFLVGSTIQHNVEQQSTESQFASNYVFPSTIGSNNHHQQQQQQEMQVEHAEPSASLPLAFSQQTTNSAPTLPSLSFPAFSAAPHESRFAPTAPCEPVVALPADLFENWICVVAPRGMRCLIVSAGGQTAARRENGSAIEAFPSVMPNGGLLRHHNIRDQCLLDCVAVVGKSRRIGTESSALTSGVGSIVNSNDDANTLVDGGSGAKRREAVIERVNSYYVLDVLEWCGAEMTSCEAEMRAFWMRSKYAEYDNFIQQPTPAPKPIPSARTNHSNQSQLDELDDNGMEEVKNNFNSERMQQLQSAIALYSTDSPSGLFTTENASSAASSTASHAQQNTMTIDNSVNSTISGGVGFTTFGDGMEIVEKKKKKNRRKKKNKNNLQQATGGEIEIEDEENGFGSQPAQRKESRPRNIVLLQKFAGLEEYRSLATVRFPWNFSVSNSVAYLYHREAHYYDNEEVTAERSPRFLTMPLQALFTALALSRASS